MSVTFCDIEPSPVVSCRAASALPLLRVYDMTIILIGTADGVDPVIETGAAGELTEPDEKRAAPYRPEQSGESSTVSTGPRVEELSRRPRDLCGVCGKLS